MSSYQRLTKRPTTGKWEMAYWLDNYFGPHEYGVKFPDGVVYDPRKVKIEVEA